MSVVGFEGKWPKIQQSIFLVPGSWVIGDFILEEGVNVWTNAVIRGDTTRSHRRQHNGVRGLPRRGFPDEQIGWKLINS
jgi:carbonic anhydrase/acetyltransferase-like protein (isoleucine patch superfamily)